MKTESADKPFKTIQACLNYVCDNYNLSRYSVVINLSQGTYTSGGVENTSGVINLPSYATSSGQIILQGATLDAADTVLNYRVALNTSLNYQLKNLTIAPTVKSTNAAGYTLLSVMQGILELYNVKLDLSYVEGHSIYIYSRTGMSVQNYGYIRIPATNSQDIPNGLIFDFKESSLNIIPISLVTGRVQMTADIEIIGSLSTSQPFVAVEQLSVFSLGLSALPNPGRTPQINISESSEMNCKRYSVNTNSILRTGGQGAEFFPGSVAGTVSSGGQYT